MPAGTGNPAEAAPMRRAPSVIEFIYFRRGTVASAGSEITSLDAHREQERDFWRDGDRDQRKGGGISY